MDTVPFCFQWDCVLGNLNIILFFLELREDQNKVGNALKFNSSSLKYESLCKVVMEN